MKSVPIKQILVFVSAAIVITHYFIQIPNPIPQAATIYVTLYAIANAVPNIRPPQTQEEVKE